MLLVIMVSYVVVRQQLLKPIDESLIERAELLAGIPDVEGGGDFGNRPVQGLLRPGQGDFDATYYQLILADGTVLDFGSQGLELSLPVPDVEVGSEPALRSIWVDDVHLRVVTVEAPRDSILQIARPLTETDAALASISLRLVVLGLLGIAGAAGLGLLVSRTAVRPIEGLRDDVGTIAETEALAERVTVEGDDEVAQLARTFNGLLAKLEGSREQQVRLVRDAGHELRTPLTALRMNLEILVRHEVSDEERTEMLEAANAEVEELSDLVAEVVDLATDRYVAEPVTDVGLDDLVGAAAERLHRRNGRAVEVTSDGSVVSGRREALDRVVLNLVMNADEWSPDGAAIEVEVSEGGVTVRDSGPGFADKDIPFVFERFFRSDEARTKPGSGLGLSIVAQIVSDHGGKVFARNREDTTGAEVGFALPSQRSAV